MKRVLAMVLSVLLCLLLLTACNGQGEVVGGSDGPTSMVVSGQENNSTPVDADAWFNEHYVDESKLPVLDVDIENPFVSDDRTLILDDDIDNKLELLVYEYFHDETAGAFANQMSKVKGEAMEDLVNGGETQFKEGAYNTKLTLDEVDLLDKEDLKDVRVYQKQYFAEALIELDMTECAIVKVKKTQKQNDKLLSMELQRRDGTYEDYFLLGKKDDDYKIVRYDWVSP